MLPLQLLVNSETYIRYGEKSICVEESVFFSVTEITSPNVTNKAMVNEIGASGIEGW